MELDDRPLRRRQLPAERVVVVHGMRCPDGVQTMIDLAGTLDDLTWERALESALRPASAPPTGSLLETLMVQLARRIDGLATPVRQLLVENAHGDFVAYVDLAWPELGLFLEVDGQQHQKQPVYDARRETAVVAEQARRRPVAS